MGPAITPEKVLRKDFLRSYRTERDALHAQMLSMNTRLFFMRKLLDFPFHLFSDDQLFGFWDTVYYSLFESTIVTMYRVGLDTHKSGVLTLQGLAKTVSKNIAEESDRETFDNACKKSILIQQHEELRTKVSQIRNHFIAHVNRDKISLLSRSQSSQLHVTLSELETIRTAMNDYFAILCLGEGLGVMLIQYDGKTQDHSELTDIDALLDWVARSSPVLNMPEQDPNVWRVHREDLSEDDVAVLNHWRVKFSLQPV